MKIIYKLIPELIGGYIRKNNKNNKICNNIQNLITKFYLVPICFNKNHYVENEYRSGIIYGMYDVYNLEIEFLEKMTIECDIGIIIYGSGFVCDSLWFHWLEKKPKVSIKFDLICGKITVFISNLNKDYDNGYCDGILVFDREDVISFSYVISLKNHKKLEDCIKQITFSFENISKK